MNILKRFEIWVLVLIVGGVLAVVLTTGDDDGDDPATKGQRAKAASGSSAMSPDSPFSVTASHLKRDFSSGVLEVHITYNNRTGGELELVPPTARLFSGSGPESTEPGVEVSPFILAFSPPPTIPPGGDASANLKFWVEKEHLEGALWLRILDDTQLVKSAAPFDLESIPNQETAVFEGTDWVATP